MCPPIQIVCERSEAYALGCAVGRAFPRYQRSSGVTAMVVQMMTVAFLFVGEERSPLTNEERMCMRETTGG